MKTVSLRCLVVAFVLIPMSAIAVADDAKDGAIKKDRQRIEGTWRIVELIAYGIPADEKQLTVVNGSDGTWSLRSDGKEIGRGTSTFDPTQKPKTIDFTPATGDAKGKLHLGIYELGDNARKLCFAPPGRERPAEFSSEPGSGHILVKFERMKVE